MSLSSLVWGRSATAPRVAVFGISTKGTVVAPDGFEEALLRITNTYKQGHLNAKAKGGIG